ncbi:MAG: starch-binding protein [Paludibacter sp.]|nr:starch-binding protein [Bacteroidales bacterium]MCM1069191.1 starch-binding protein [Prevotella sp.]MCM1354096.1 starch-binding protein [Bacteroides sp.]MCM1442931.1 starch-binding protein [Muribaculum sp.]MCM1481746.1 starch-binding protein [Paludibacter sp.]
MKKITLMLAFAVLSMAANALTIFYKNTNNWQEVAAYTFSAETLGTWPGTVMTAVADHEGWFSIDVDETKTSSIIFNNNNKGSQTGNLTIDAAKPYYNEGWTTGFDGEVIVETYTVYYNNVNNWDKVYAYGWGGSAVTAGWPGDEMSPVTEQAGWYAIDFRGGLPEKIIFNKGEGGAGNQTDDLIVDAENLYYNNGWTNGFTGEIVVVTPEAMYLKHPFDGSTWEWKAMAKNTDNTFTLDAYWQGTGANVNTEMNDAGAKWFPADDISNCPAITGVMVTYVYDATTASLSIVADETPAVYLTVPTSAVIGEKVEFSATSANVSNPVYIYSVQTPGTSEYVALEGNTYTPEVEGVYGVKVTVTGDGLEQALEDTKQMTVTKTVELNGDYYLVGYINGADYGIEADADNTGEYKFVDGKLTATFTADSYVFIKTGDNQNWYMAMEYAGESPAVLVNTLAGGKEKLFVPGNVQVDFTLVANSDATLTLSYVTKSGTALDNLTAEYVLAVSNGNLAIMLDNAAPVAVYTVGGQVIDAQTTANYSRNLTTGVYIVRIGTATEKIVVF